MSNVEHYIGLMYKKLKGEISMEELSEVDRFISKDSKNAALFEEIRQSWNLTQDTISETPDSKVEWLELVDRLESSDSNQAPKAKAQVFSLRRMLVAASVFLIAGFFFLRSLDNSSNQLNLAAIDSVITGTLVDGTKVWLNQDARINSDSGYSKEHRTVQLQGEAYFDVFENKYLPFKIEMEGISVEVLGTAFHILPIKDGIEINVEEGVVKVTDLAINQSKELRVGDYCVVNIQTHSFSVNREVRSNKLFWKTKRLFYQDHNLGSVIQELSQLFEEEIQILNPALANCQISGSFKGDSLDEVLQLIGEQLEAQHEYTGKYWTLRGGRCR